MKVPLHGEVDAAQREQLTEELTVAAREATARGEALVVDFAAATFMDSTGISCLIAAGNELASPDDLHLVNVPRNIRRVLEITGLDHLCRD